MDLEFVEIRLGDISGSIVVDETAIRDYYDVNADRLRAQEQRRARHILIAVDANREPAVAETLIADLAQRLAGGEDFAVLAAEFSDDPVSAKEGGDLGWAGRDDFVPCKVPEGS